MDSHVVEIPVAVGREVLRYRKGSKTRVYNVRDVEESTELWVASEERGRPTKSRSIVTFDNPDDIPPFLEDVERELRAGGWVRS